MAPRKSWACAHERRAVPGADASGGHRDGVRERRLLGPDGDQARAVVFRRRHRALVEQELIGPGGVEPHRALRADDLKPQGVRHAGGDPADRHLGAAAAGQLDDRRGDVVGGDRAQLGRPLDRAVTDDRAGRDRPLRDEDLRIRGDHAPDRPGDVLQHAEHVRADVHDRSPACLPPVIAPGRGRRRRRGVVREIPGGGVPHVAYFPAGDDLRDRLHRGQPPEREADAVDQAWRVLRVRAARG